MNINAAPTNIFRYIGLFLVSASLLLLQVTFTRIFSIMIWYHFAYLIIGIALLGGGAAGTFLLVRQWSSETISKRLSLLSLLLSLSIVLSLLVINVVRFDPLSNDSPLLANVGGLASYFSIIFLIYFLGGLIVAGIFRRWADDAHRLYFSDLLGAGLSSLLALWLIQVFSGPGAVILAAVLALIASTIFWNANSSISKGISVILIVGELILLIFLVFNPIYLPVPQSKELGRLLSLVGTEKSELSIWNPVARVDVLPTFESEVPWILGGISSAYVPQRDYRYQQKFVTLDGTSMTVLFRFDDDLSPYEFLDYTIISAPYKLSPSAPRVLNIGVGGGLDIILAKKYGAKHITAVELNSDVVELIKHTYSDFVGDLAADPNIDIVVAEGRNFLIHTTEQYDIIQGIGLDNFAALNGGAYVLSESYLYTVDAVEVALNRLSPNGIFAWTRTVYTPPREMLRLMGVAAEALRREGVLDPGKHIAIVANEDGQYATLLVSKQPFTEQALQEFREWVARNHFTMLHDPLRPLDTVYFEYLTSPSPRAFEAAYPFNIFPVTDDNPFFYNYFKWTNLVFMFDSGGDVNLRFPLGNLVILVMLIFSSITAVIFIFYPLLKYRRGGLEIPNAVPMLTYFALLGLAYIMIEVVLIQRFTLFIGYPSRAIAVTIFGMLVFSALGSLTAQKLVVSLRGLRVMLILLVALLAVYLVGLSPLLERLLGLPEQVRIWLGILILAPLGMCMGIPYPTGLYQLSARAQDLIPWAWGVNGVFSVLGSVLVILISMQTSFTVAFGVATLFYLLAYVVSPYLWKTRLVEAGGASKGNIVVQKESPEALTD